MNSNIAGMLAQKMSAYSRSERKPFAFEMLVLPAGTSKEVKLVAPVTFRILSLILPASIADEVSVISLKVGGGGSYREQHYGPLPGELFSHTIKPKRRIPFDYDTVQLYQEVVLTLQSHTCADLSIRALLFGVTLP